MGKTNEVDGVDIPPELRNAIINQEGVWGLFINNSENSMSVIFSILRKELNLSLAEIASIRKKVPGVILTGTQIEMERLRGILSSTNMPVSVLKLEDKTC
ncbi:hypothetical protein [Clostridium saccharoperbutylacetonicum]|uniref:hypothetical protein n=1 Tax=Clostridium saccharoperbutylacetonicum TaxID=36745 RepID=UPI00098557E1|nr:hypothetical protein [Clostridium saccharoperbutylacetonicum]NSB29947.1 hypothetical protein [Clostridium saccharoperbutylacetonicum]